MASRSFEQETHVEQVAHHEEHQGNLQRTVQRHDFPIIASITWTRTIFVMVAAGNVVA